MTRSSGSLFYKPKSRAQIVKEKRWNWPRIIGKALAKTCMVIGAVVLVSVFLAGFLSGAMKRTGPVMPSEMILTLNLEYGVGERPRTPTLADPFPFRRPTVREIVDTLEKAAEDERVKALLVKMESTGIGLAHIEEIRPAIEKFRASGKTTRIYSSSYGGIGSGLGTFYLASAFDEIWMQPVGMVSFSGLAFEVPYARELLDKIGARPQFFQREEYKNAMESFTNRSMSAASRETFESIADDFYARALKDIEARRNIPGFKLKELIDKGLLTGPEALEAGLIDRLDYADVLVTETRESLGFEEQEEKPEMISLGRYSQAKQQSRFALRGKKGVALVYATGTIMPSAEGERGIAAADEIAGAINTAMKDDSVDAIILRVDSPGGSPAASETIHRAIVRAQARGKMVIVSMGSVAASGGYWIAADAERIFALPSTLTGSIGVVMGKFELSQLWEKVGVNWEGIRRGRNAEMWSINEPFDPSEEARMNALIDHTYDSFLERVADGRELSLDQVREVAKGRAWTGTEAVANGLVDELGGLNDALDYVAGRFDLESRRDLNVTVLPKPQSAIEQLADILGAQVAIGRFLQSFMPYTEDLQSVMNAARLSGPQVHDPALDQIQ